MYTDFDDFLPVIGANGVYQRGLFISMCLPASLPAAFLAFSQVFLSYTPDHWCRIPELTGLPPKRVKDLAIPDKNLGSHDKCRQYDADFTSGRKLSNNRSWSVTKCRFGWDYDKSDFQSTLVTEV